MKDIIKGTFPSNIIVERSCGAGQGGKHEPYCVCGMLDEQSGELKSGTAVRRNKGVSGSGWKSIAYPDTKEDVGYGDKGGASRFFKIIK